MTSLQIAAKYIASPERTDKKQELSATCDFFHIEVD